MTRNERPQLRFSCHILSASHVPPLIDKANTFFKNIISPASTYYQRNKGHKYVPTFVNLDLLSAMHIAHFIIKSSCQSWHCQEERAPSDLSLQARGEVLSLRKIKSEDVDDWIIRRQAETTAFILKADNFAFSWFHSWNWKICIKPFFSTKSQTISSRNYKNRRYWNTSHYIWNNSLKLTSSELVKRV